MGFILHVAAGLDAEIEPKMPDAQLDGSVVNDEAMFSEHMPLRESAAQRFSLLPERPQRENESAKAAKKEHSDDVPVARFQHPDPADPSSSDLPLLGNIVSIEMGNASAGSRLRWGVAALLLVLATMVMALYYYHGLSAQLTEHQGENQRAPVRFVNENSGNAPTSSMSVPIAPAPIPFVATKKGAISAESPEIGSSLVRRGGGDTIPIWRSSAADADVRRGQNSPIVNECQEVVAALGFCNPDLK